MCVSLFASLEVVWAEGTEILQANTFTPLSCLTDWLILLFNYNNLDLTAGLADTFFPLEAPTDSYTLFIMKDLLALLGSA